MEKKTTREEQQRPGPRDWESQEYWLMNQMGPEPLIHPGQLEDPVAAMGVALFHLSAACMEYLCILEEGQEQDQDQGKRRYLWAEPQARTVHLVLHRVHEELADQHPRRHEIQRNCQMARLMLGRMRRDAAAALGIRPPPDPEGGGLEQPRID